MKKHYSKTERRGLPGGPNEFLQNITQYISVEGYKSDSPDVNNPFNIIESSNITMEDVDFPVRGYGNNGVVQDMTPGVPHYDYGNADYVVEVPMAQDGGDPEMISGDPEMIFKDEYNTPLTKEEKIEYEAWVASESERQGRDIMWDLGTYDIQGFWKSGDYMKRDKDNHGSDRWKKPNHPTFSDQSNYHNVNGFLGGTWAPDGGFTASPHTLKWYDKAYYKKLFGREPNRPEYLIEEKQKGGGLLDKTMKCNSCGWSWKAADGGADVSTCHKCGGSALPMAQKAGEIVDDEDKMQYGGDRTTQLRNFQYDKKRNKKMQTAGETEELEKGVIPTEMTTDGIDLDPIVLSSPKRKKDTAFRDSDKDGNVVSRFLNTGRGRKRKELFEDMPEYMQVADDGDYTLGFEDMQRLENLGITDLDSYNDYFGTVYNRDNALNEYNYLNTYKPEYDELISSIHGATNTAAKNIMEAASFIPVVRGASLLTKTPQALRFLANSPVGRTASKYIGQPFSKAMNYRPVSTGATVGQTLDGVGFVYGAGNIAPDTKQFIDNPTLGNAGTVGLDVLSMGIPAFNTAKYFSRPATSARGVQINQFSDRGISPTNFDDVSDIDMQKIKNVRDNIFDVSPSSNPDLTDGLEMLGRNTDEIDNFITTRLDEIKPGSEGFNRLVQQELNHLKTSGYTPPAGTTLDDAAQSASLARYQELSNLKGNTINHHARNMFNDGAGNPSSKHYDYAKGFIQKNQDLFTNAYFRNPSAGGTMDDLINVTKSSPVSGDYSFTTRLGLKPGRGTIGIGPMFNGKNLNAVLDHEIAHLFNANRPMALSDELRVLKPNSLVNTNLDMSSGTGFGLNKSKAATGSKQLTSDYDYFATGSPNPRQGYIGDEPMPFAVELRRSMLERGLINGIYDEITPSILNAAKKSFSAKPTGLTQQLPGSADSFFSTTRLLDFLDPSTYSQLSKTINKVPAIVPPAIIGAAGLNQQKEGGSVSWNWKGKSYSGTLIPSMENENNRYARTENGKIKTLPKAQDGGRVSDIWQSVTGTPWSSAKEQGLTDGSYDINIKLRSELLNNPDKFKPVPSNQLPSSNTPNAPISTLSGVEVNDKINSAQDFSSAFKIARDYYGPNKIFNYNNKNYGTNLKGEEFNPSDEDMSNAGLRQREAQDIQVQNDLVVSPYTDTNIVEIDSYEDWNTTKNRMTDMNKMGQADLIVDYQSTKSENSYVIVDKKKGLMHIYEPGAKEPVYSSPIDLGAVMGDAQTVTKYRDLNNDGVTTEEEINIENIDWSQGNKSTGAGRYKISNIDRVGYRGKPLFNFSNESGSDVATSFHAGFIDDDNSRVSNGCIRCNQASLDKLTQYLQNSSEVFILPEDEGNKFVFENGQLNFRYGSGKDYEKYKDSNLNEQKGQGINKTVNTLNYKPIEVSIDRKFKENQFNETNFFGDDDEEYNKTVVPFAKSLQDNKQLVMKNLKVNGDVYNDLAALAFGIFGNETNFGDTHSAIGNTVRAGLKLGSSFYDKAIDSLGLSNSLKVGPRGSADYKTERNVNNLLGDIGISNPNNASMGLTQVRWSQILEEPQLVKSLASLGITSGKDFDDPKKAALGTVGILAYLRNNRQGGNVAIEDLPRLYAGTSSSDTNRDAYTRNALENSKYLNIKQKKFQVGGPVSAPSRAGMIVETAKGNDAPIISNDLLLRQLFKESSFNADAISKKDAKGIAQFTPITIEEMKRLKMVGNDFNPYDIKQAIPAQKKWMNYLSERPYLNKGNDESVLAKILFAYNAGPTGAKESITKLKNKGVDVYNSTDWTDSINNQSSDYINKILKRKDSRFNDEFENIIINPKYNNIMEYFKQKGGPLRSMNKIYKNYIKGIYKEGGSKEQAQRVYDKLNRMNYKSAKSANMTIPNYIMTHVIGNS